MAGQHLHGQANAVVAKDLVTFRDVVKKVLPAVVSIEAKAKTVKVQRPATPRVPRNFNNTPIPEEFKKFFEGMEEVPFEGQDAPRAGFGSGVLVDPSGIILTNYHVVNGAESVEIQLTDGRKFTSKDIKTDAKTDLAIIRLQGQNNLPFVEMGDSDQMEVGDRVLAVGAPFGLSGSVTHGIISAKGRTGLSMNFYEDFLQTDAAINPGNSGGPLINMEGKIIGINSAIRTRSGGFQGVGLAIASNMAKTVKDQLLKDGVVRRGYLGVQIKDLVDRDVAERLGLKKDQAGVLVSLVFEKSPAGKAGVVAGDVITMVNGKPVKDGRELQRLIADLPLGKPVDVMMLRDGKEMAVKVTIEEQPNEFGSARAPVQPSSKPEGEAVGLDKVGVTVTDLTPELAKKHGYSDKDKGVLITSVEPGSRAANAGLGKGILITQVDKQPVESAEKFKEMVDGASMEKGLLLQYHSPQAGIGYLMLKDQ